MFRAINKFAFFASVLMASTSMADIIDGEELVDPTRPFQLTNGSTDTSVVDLIRTVIPSSYDLSFIRAGGDSPMAVINQQQLTIGDEIGGAEVIDIDRSGVTLRVDNEEQRISLYGVNVKSNTVSN